MIASRRMHDRLLLESCRVRRDVPRGEQAA
jgi:hypothetical protein